MEKKLLLQVKNLQISWLLDNALIPIVCGLDFSLKSGKVLALVGESGCGKSVTSLSLLRLLAKELKIVDGEILFYGQNGEETLDMVKNHCTPLGIKSWRSYNFIKILPKKKLRELQLSF